jgi:2-polyprenyl-6-methoxyphenol hydroxylase-like FAD-dependent oxidoreductase
MKVVICGAGIAGLTLANRISALGGDVTLLERAPGPRSQGYMIDFFGPGFDAAEAMGLLPAIGELAYPVDEVSLVDEHGRRRAGVPYAQFAKAVHARLRSVMRPDLEQVLRRNLPEDVDLRFGATLVGVADRGDAVLITLDTVGRQMGFYVLRDGRVAAFAVHRTPDATLPEDVRAAVRDAYRPLGWLVPEALEKCPSSEEIYYGQVAQVEVPSWRKWRVALVGDACSAVSLLAGQGASLGVAGAYLLADQLHQAPTIDRALADYQRLWRPVAEEKQKTGRGAARWFLPESALQLRIRRAALRLAWLPVINRFVGATLAGKSTALIQNLREVSSRPPKEGAKP